LRAYTTSYGYNAQWLPETITDAFALVFIVAAAGAEIVFRLDAPIGKKAVFRQFGIGKRAADGHFGYGDNRFFDALMG